MAKKITLLGSTGSIGTQSLDVARAQGYRVFGLAANRQVELLARQNRAYQAEFELMRQSEEQVSALRHDMKNHLAVLREYAARGQEEELVRYLDRCLEKVRKFP